VRKSVAAQFDFPDMMAKPRFHRGRLARSLMDAAAMGGLLLHLCGAGSRQYGQTKVVENGLLGNR
jgi:hypothetical protein